MRVISAPHAKFDCVTPETLHTCRLSHCEAHALFHTHSVVFTSENKLPQSLARFGLVTCPEAFVALYICVFICLRECFALLHKQLCFCAHLYICLVRVYLPSPHSSALVNTMRACLIVSTQCGRSP